MKDADHAIGVLNKGPPAMDLAKKSSRGKRRRLLGDLKWLHRVAELKWQWTLRDWFWLIILFGMGVVIAQQHRELMNLTKRMGAVEAKIWK